MAQTPFQMFLQSKGLTDDTAERWGVEPGADGDSAIFRYPAGRKIRGNISGNGKRTFKYDGISGLYRLSDPLQPTVFICEGESDSLRLWQEFENSLYRGRISVVGLSGINGWKQEYAREFEGVERIRCVLDNDSDYAVRATVDRAFVQMASDLGRSRVRRIYLPPATKDVVEFFDGYSLKSFIEIAKPSSKTNYARLDLNATPPLTEWLVEGLLCKGDITLVTGPPNIGKSMISMSLALAVAEGRQTFLGQPLNVPTEGSPVLCVDEENPIDVVYSRLLGMGMTERGKKNIHYYHSQGIRLDRSPERLLDDALIVNPTLITIDAMTRVHSKEENDSGAINQLFNEAIIPLGRQTGASVLVIHAVNKGEGSNSFNKIRGSSDLGYAVDCGIEIEQTTAMDENGTEREALKLTNFKARRTKRGAKFTVFIETGLTGEIELVTAKDGF